MRFSKISSVFLASLPVLAGVNGLNILISNDDGFGTANIRELYKAMKALGHNCYIVASVVNESGMGGAEVYTKYQNLTSDSEFGKQAIVLWAAINFSPCVRDRESGSSIHWY